MSKKRNVLGKVIAPILTALCILCFFNGWIIAQNSYTEQSFNAIVAEINSVVDSTPTEMLDAQLEEFGASISGQTMIKHFKQMTGIIEDGGVSPVEFGFRTQFIMDYFALSKAGFDIGLGDSVLSAVIVARLFILITRIALILTFAYYIITIVMTIKGGRFWNIFAIILSLGWWVVWLFAYVAIRGEFYDLGLANDELGILLSNVSIFPVLLSILALIFAIIGNKKDKNDKKNAVSKKAENNDKKETDGSGNDTEAGKNDKEGSASADTDNVNSQFVLTDADDPESDIRIFVPDIEALNERGIDVVNAKTLLDLSKETVSEGAPEEKPASGMSYVNVESVEGNFVRCPSCGQINDNDAKECIMCGSKL